MCVSDISNAKLILTRSRGLNGKKNKIKTRKNINEIMFILSSMI